MDLMKSEQTEGGLPLGWCTICWCFVQAHSTASCVWPNVCVLLLRPNVIDCPGLWIWPFRMHLIVVQHLYKCCLFSVGSVKCMCAVYFSYWVYGLNHSDSDARSVTYCTLYILCSGRLSGKLNLRVQSTTIAWNYGATKSFTISCHTFNQSIDAIPSVPSHTRDNIEAVA